MDFIGGRIETAIFEIPPSFAGFTVPLQATGVRLKRLLALTDYGDLEATGTLNGRIPVTIADGEVTIRNGVLETAPGGGSIRYRPKAVGAALAEANEGTALFLKIVEDFRYDKVRVSLKENDAGEIALKFRIKGRNKAVYRGIPVVLNVNVSGPVGKILRQGARTFTLPKRLSTQLRGVVK